MFPERRRIHSIDHVVRGHTDKKCGSSICVYISDDSAIIDVSADVCY